MGQAGRRGPARQAARPPPVCQTAPDERAGAQERAIQTGSEGAATVPAGRPYTGPVQLVLRAHSLGEKARLFKLLRAFHTPD